jgi:hypothetical protein
MPIGILFWVLLILTVVAMFLGSAYPLVSFGMLLLLISLLGWQVFGQPLHRS